MEMVGSYIILECYLDCSTTPDCVASKFFYHVLE